MSGASQITFIVFFETTFLSLMTLLGLALTTTTGDQLNFLLNVIFAPFPNAPPQANIGSCAWYDVACNSANISNATSFIGGGIIYLGALGFSFLTRLNAFGQIFFILFNPSIGGSLSGIPFVSSILYGIQIIILIFAIIIVRGNPSGG